MPVSGHKARKLDITNGTKKVTRKLEIFPEAGADAGSRCRCWELVGVLFWWLLVFQWNGTKVGSWVRRAGRGAGLEERERRGQAARFQAALRGLWRRATGIRRVGCVLPAPGCTGAGVQGRGRFNWR